MCTSHLHWIILLPILFLITWFKWLIAKWKNILQQEYHWFHYSCPAWLISDSMKGPSYLGYWLRFSATLMAVCTAGWVRKWLWQPLLLASFLRVMLLVRENFIFIIIPLFSEIFVRWYSLVHWSHERLKYIIHIQLNIAHYSWPLHLQFYSHSTRL